MYEELQLENKHLKNELYQPQFDLSDYPRKHTDHGKQAAETSNYSIGNLDDDSQHKLANAQPSRPYLLNSEQREMNNSLQDLHDSLQIQYQN